MKIDKDLTIEGFQNNVKLMISEKVKGTKLTRLNSEKSVDISNITQGLSRQTKTDDGKDLFVYHNGAINADIVVVTGGEKVMVFPSSTAAGKIIGLGASTIRKRCLKDYVDKHDYKWSFEPSSKYYRSI